MNELPRLRERDPLVAELIAEAHAVEPPSEALARTLAKVAAAAPAAAVASMAAHPIAGASRGAFLKLTPLKVLLSVVVATLGIFAAYGLRATPSTSSSWVRSPAVGTPVVTENAAPAAKAPRVPDESVPTVRVEDLPKAASATASQAAQNTTRRATLGEELALLERARRDLALGDFEGCLRSLDQYEHTYTSAVFADEAMVTRIEALFATGQRNPAMLLGRKFVSMHPTSPHVDRVRSLMHDAETTEGRTQDER